MHGAGNHFDTRGPNERYPVAMYREDGEILDRLPRDFDYSSNYYASRMIEYIGAAADQDAPFFAYVAFTAPHWPLQAPEEYIRRYKGRYDGGYESLRSERFARLEKPGVAS